jgi:hypothetical protein
MININNLNVTMKIKPKNNFIVLTVSAKWNSLHSFFNNAYNQFFHLTFLNLPLVVYLHFKYMKSSMKYVGGLRLKIVGCRRKTFPSFNKFVLFLCYFFIFVLCYSFGNLSRAERAVEFNRWAIVNILRSSR